jgi:PKD repeat protein
MPRNRLSSARLSNEASSFGSVVTLASTAGLPTVAMNEAGEAATAWPSGFGVQVATAAPGAAFGSPVTLPSRFTPSAAHVAVGATGGLAIEWDGTTEGGGELAREGSSRPPGGTFARPTGIYTTDTTTEGSMVVASDSAGDMVGVWTSTDLNDMESMLYDVGPQLGDISAPTGGVTGQPVVFSIASPASAWRPLSSVTWNFGDGTTASGLSVEHVYTEPGSYAVSVTATDAQHTGLPFHPPLLPEYVASSESQIITVTSAAPAQSSQANAMGAMSESLSGLRVTPASFVAATSGPSANAADRGIPRTGTTVRFDVAHAGFVTFRIDRSIAGLMHGRKCLPQRSGSSGSRARRCTLLSTLGHFLRGGSAGSNSFHFAGRIRTGKLRPGSYLLLAAAADSRQPAERVTFRVLSH